MKAIKRFLLKRLLPFLEENVDIKQSLTFDDGKAIASVQVKVLGRVIYEGSKEIEV